MTMPWFHPAATIYHLRNIHSYFILNTSLQWHNGHDSVSNHQPHECLLNRLFKRRSKKTWKLSVTGLCAGNSPVTDEFPAQMASNADNVSIWWRHHVFSHQIYTPLLQQIQRMQLKIVPTGWNDTCTISFPLCHHQRKRCSLSDNKYNVSLNTLKPNQNWRHFPDDIFKCIFLKENVSISIRISPKFVPRGPVNNILALI